MDFSEDRPARRPRKAGGPAVLVSAAAAMVGAAAASLGWPGAGSERAAVSFVTDVEDPRRLVGVVDNVFVGRVDGVEDVHMPSGVPETLYRVTVTDNIKGHLEGGVTVNQLGGMAPGARAPTLVEDDDLLVVGGEYLFATRVGGDGAWHTLVPRYGDVRITDDAARARLVEAFRRAATEAIPFER